MMFLMRQIIVFIVLCFLFSSCETSTKEDINVQLNIAASDTTRTPITDSLNIGEKNTLSGKTDKNVRLKLVVSKENQGLKLALIMSCLFILLFSGFLVLFRFYKKRKVENEKIKQEIIRKEHKINNLIKELSDLTQKNDLDSASTPDIVSAKEKLLAEALINSDRVYRKARLMKEQSNELKSTIRLEEIDWNNFVRSTDLVFNCFVENLRSTYPDLSDWDVRICCLVKHKFSQKIIAQLIGIELKSFQKRRTRIMQNKMKLKGDRVSFEDLIENEL